MIKNYALIENNVVVNIIVADDDFISMQSGQWIEYTDERPAYIGVELVDGILVQPKPFPSWTLDSNYDWQAPVAKPTGNNVYEWNEILQNWEQVSVQ